VSCRQSRSKTPGLRASATCGGGEGKGLRRAARTRLQRPRSFTSAPLIMAQKGARMKSGMPAFSTLSCTSALLRNMRESISECV
jgi:hypothetical protein